VVDWARLALRGIRRDGRAGEDVEGVHEATAEVYTLIVTWFSALGGPQGHGISAEQWPWALSGVSSPSTPRNLMLYIHAVAMYPPMPFASLHEDVRGEHVPRTKGRN
jgi:hypothetical protein